MDKTVYVLYAPIFGCDISEPLYPKERYNEILRAKSERVKSEKYLVWKLLKKAVSKFTSFEFDNIKFTKTANGKWICPEFYFSLSHTDAAVCVALSYKEIGVDIEKVRQVKERLADKILTEDEKEYLALTDKETRGDFLLECWVKKESIFKMRGGEALLPTHLDTLSAEVFIKRVTVLDEEYIIALAGEYENTIIRYTEAI